MKVAHPMLMAGILAMTACLADCERGARLGQWRFDVDKISTALRQSLNPAAGVKLSSQAINPNLTDFGNGIVPSGDDDGMGFGGNNGVKVMFWQCANYTNTNAPPQKAPTWSVSGVDADHQQ